MRCGILEPYSCSCGSRPCICITMWHGHAMAAQARLPAKLLFLVLAAVLIACLAERAQGAEASASTTSASTSTTSASGTSSCFFNNYWYRQGSWVSCSSCKYKYCQW
jgi:hypothetical protein